MTSTLDSKNRQFQYRCVILLSALIFCAALILSYPFLISNLFFHMPKPSATFDCDDAALVMTKHFNSIGVRTVTLLGNLKMSGEKYPETDHTWVLVNIGNFVIPFDWGIPRFDQQHYEGYTLTEDQLLFFVNQDFISQGQPAAYTLP